MTAGRFFCEHCGVQVALDAHECPSCHRLFGEVRCPRCHYTDKPGAFRNGCPECGYMATGNVKKRKQSMFVPAMAVLLVLLGAAVVVAWMLKS